MNNIWIVNTPIGELEIHSDINYLYLLQFVNKKEKNKIYSRILSDKPLKIFENIIAHRILIKFDTNFVLI